MPGAHFGIDPEAEAAPTSRLLVWLGVWVPETIVGELPLLLERLSHELCRAVLVPLSVFLHSVPTEYPVWCCSLAPFLVGGVFITVVGACGCLENKWAVIIFLSLLPSLCSMGHCFLQSHPSW